ncbi:MAG: chromate resistance protein ChrB domain-containing protein [Pseudomonadota bacterium]
MTSQTWILLILKLPGKSASARMRVWRALKGSGAAMLRDGVYVLPDTPSHASAFLEQRDAVTHVGGSAYVLRVSDTAFHDDVGPHALFDRAALYEDWLSSAGEFLDQLPVHDEPGARETETRLRRNLDAIAAVDFFPSDAQQIAVSKLADVSRAVNARYSPEEPSSGSGQIERADPGNYQDRLWATRQDLWVDRVASAWLIQRFIDTGATFEWLAHTQDCPSDAVGFDYDGADFTHVGPLVTYQVLLKAFDLHGDASLTRIGDVVRYLDVGGPAVSDAAGILSLLAGTKRRSDSDHDFLRQATPLFDNLYAAYGDGPWRKD